MIYPSYDVICDICGETYKTASDFDQAVVVRSNHHLDIGKSRAIIAYVGSKSPFDICNDCLSRIQEVIDLRSGIKRD